MPGGESRPVSSVGPSSVDIGTNTDGLGRCRLLLRLGRLLARGRSRLGGGSSSGVAGGSSGITRGGSSVTSSFLSLTGSVARRCSGILSGLCGLFLLRARSQRQRQRDGGENHFCVHVSDHPCD